MIAPPAKLKSFITDRPVAVFMVFLAAVVFGYFSLSSLSVTLMPELSYPTVTVRTEYPGAAPEEVENDVSRRIEEALGVVSGLKKSVSVSRAGVSDVVLNFEWGADVSDVTQDILERLDRVFLPNEAERPLILHFDPSLEPVMQLSFSGADERFSGEEGLKRLRRIADLQVKRFLEPVPGIAAVTVRGGLEEEIHIDIDESKLTRSRLSISEVIDRVNKENINVAGGKLNEGGTEYTVRTLNEFQNIEEIRQTIIRFIDDKPVRVEDVATVTLAFKQREIITRANGLESVQIDIFKEADANMVELSKEIRRLIGTVNLNKWSASNATKNTREKKSEEANKNSRKKSDQQGERGGKKWLQLAPHLYQNEGALLKVVSDRAIFVDSAVSEVKKTAISGGLLAILVLFLFLRNLKSTFIIAVSIPISILITFAPMYLSGVSLNIMSLGGLALGIGMLVDSSIVVLEAIQRCKEEGDSLKQAVIRGTNEVRGAVFASVLTSIAVFFPIVFVEGIAGQAFGDLGIAVVVSLAISLIVAVTFIPMLASRETLTRVKKPDSDGFVSSLFLPFTEIVKAFYLAVSALPLLAKVTLIALLYFLIRALIQFIYQFIRLVCSLLLRSAFLGLGYFFVGLGYVYRPLLLAPANFVGKGLAFLTKGYKKVLIWTLSHLSFMGGFIFACFLLVWGLLLHIDTELLPQTYQGEFTIEASLPVGTPIERTVSVFDEIEKRIVKMHPEIDNLLVTYGYDVVNSQSSREGEHSAKFNVILKPSANQQRAEKKTVSVLRQYFNDIPDVDMRILRPVLFSQTTPLEVEVYADDLSELKNRATSVKNTLNELPELADVEASLKSGAPEIQIIYDRNKIIKQGLSISAIAQNVRDMVKGFEATKFNKIDRRVPIMVQLGRNQTEKVDRVRHLIVNPGEDIPITLSSVAQLVEGEGPSEVRRINGQRAAVISANLGDASLSDATLAIEQALNNKYVWDSNLSFAVTGQNQEWENTKWSLFLALGLSIFLVYVIMASQFESFIHPLIIMFAIPLAFVGTLAGLYVFSINISIVVLLGVIMLTGLVVNNAIVLVDYINKLRERGMALHDAIVLAGSVRLRPILMTTATTVLGLLPMALGLGDGAEIRTPMAIAVITGLFSSTVLTLLVIPSIYLFCETLRDRFFSHYETPQADQLT